MSASKQGEKPKNRKIYPPLQRGGNARAGSAAQFLGVHEATFWRWVKQGRIPGGRKVGGLTVWPADEIFEAAERLVGGCAA